MEGYLMIPPDRGTIIGRAVWKVRLAFDADWQLLPMSRTTSNAWLYLQSRYVVIGNPRQDKDQAALSLSQVLSPGRMKEGSNRIKDGSNRIKEGSNRLKDGNTRSSKPQPRIDPDGTYLSIYKSKVTRAGTGQDEELPADTVIG